MGTPDRSRRKRVIFLLIILVCSYLFLFHNLGSYSLKEPDEGRYAEIPREMVEQGDYVVPHLNYVRYFEKPPLLYWVTALSYKAFGISEWSFRFPNALAALLTVLMLYLFVSRWFGDETGLFSSLILLTSFGFFAIAHIVTIDMLFSFLLLAALLSFYHYYREKRPLFLHLFSAALALAVLAKGPVALILMTATVLLFLWSEKRLSFLRNMASVSALLLFCAIAAPWFVVISIREKEFFHFFFIDQHILRFITTKHHRSGPLYYFLPVLAGGLFPWSLFIPRAVVSLWRTQEVRLFFIWSLMVFLFFSLSGSKLPPYILPLFPAISIVLARLFAGRWREPSAPKAEVIVCGVFFSCLALVGFAHASGMLDTQLAGLPEIAGLPKHLRGLSISVSIASLIIVILILFRRMRTYRFLSPALGAFCLILFVGVMSHSHVIDGLNTTKELTRGLREISSPASVVVNYGSFDETLPFYLKKRTYLACHTGELEMGANYSDSRDYFLDQDTFARLFRSDRPVFMVLKAKRLARLKDAGIKGETLIACQGNRCLVANGPALRLFPGKAEDGHGR